MIHPLVAAAALLALAACSTQQTAATSALSSTPEGKLFCAIQTGGGGSLVVGVVNAAVAGTAPGASPAAVIVTGASKAAIDQMCNDAAAAVGATAGIPVAPPASPISIPNVAVKSSS